MKEETHQSRSKVIVNFIFCPSNVLAMTETTNFVWRLSNFTYTLLTIRRETVRIWVTGQGKLHLVFVKSSEPIQTSIFARSLLFSNTKVVQDEREKSYWFWLINSKVEINFALLSVKPCGYNTYYNFCSISIKVHTYNKSCQKTTTLAGRQPSLNRSHG